MLEHEWKTWLAARGIATPPHAFIPAAGAGAGAVERAARPLRPPLAVKVVARSVVHKTDVGGVRLGVADAAAAATVVAEMGQGLERRGIGPVEGYLVEEMVEPGVEVVLGLVRDPAFGPLLAFGTGGTRVEAAGEVAFFALPLRPWDVGSLLGTAGWLEPALHRVGGAGLTALRDVVWRFGGPGGIALAPEVERLEINPLVVNTRGAFAVDARGAGAAGARGAAAVEARGPSMTAAPGGTGAC